MIPLRLAVKNFMCYREDVPPLDLEGIHVACLCGDNGHGKTALLDAITWALWGQARARTQEELVHQGQSDMAVELDFQARGQRYRVTRRHSRSARSRQGSTILELQVASDNGPRPITGNSVRETELRIREILHMDYETFVNTAFLRQGDADRFTTSRPAERKETLAEVLDLSYYQGLEEQAKARSRASQYAIIAVDSDIGLRRQEISRRPGYEERLASVKETLAQLEPEVEALRLHVEDLRRAVEFLRGRRDELEELTRQLFDGQNDISRLGRQAQGYETRVNEYEAALQRRSEIQEQFSRLQEYRRELERLDQALARRSELDRDRARVEKEVAVQEERVSGQAVQLRRRMADEIEPKARRLPEIEEELRALVQDRARLGELEETVAQRHGEAQQVAASLQYIEEANTGLRGEMEESREKFNMLGKGDTVCPLCRQPLGPEGQEHLRREYEAQGLERKRQYQENVTKHEALDQRRKEIAARLSQLEAQLAHERQRTANRTANLERDRFESQEAQAGAKQAGLELQQLEAVLSTKGFARQERERLAQLDAALIELAYDDAAHRQAREQLKALERYDELHRKLNEAVERLPGEREALETSRQMLQRRQREIRDAGERKAALEEELKALPSLESQQQTTEVRYQELRSKRDATLVEQGVLEQQIERCSALEDEVRELDQERSRLLEEKGVYAELAVAFGKNGIQALIIESAVPQLNDDANELLGRLTDNRMSLKLQLQEGRRDSRTGMPSEELDIRVADEVGTRSYETFSGGEAFRINFALRIALSKLLARRSGAPLPILFIDEGFGSQDTAGQERLTQSIQSIQDDFQKIIVITHINQVKEAFPVRIEVTKTDAGSTFEVV